MTFVAPVAASNNPMTAFRAKLAVHIKALEADSSINDDLLGSLRDLDELFAAMQPIWNALMVSYGACE